MIDPTVLKPKNNQKVLIQHAGSIEPAVYNEDQDKFYRYPNHADGDRCAQYYYSQPDGWISFPDPVKSREFINEPELPFPAESFGVELTPEEKRVMDITSAKLFNEDREKVANDFVKKWNDDPVAGTYFPATRLYPEASIDSLTQHLKDHIQESKQKFNDRFPNGEPKGEDGWPTSESFSSIGL